MPMTYKRPFRYIYSDENDGYTNMAMDETVFIGLREGLSTPLLRVYKWNPPTISIGYFQKADDINFQKCKRDGIGVVRRMTGGRAVLHHEELTYSILFTEDDFNPFKKREIFLFVAYCLVDALKALNIRSKIAEKARGNSRSPDCFMSPAQFEIESYEKKKLIGSAQLMKGSIVLQHGAIPLTSVYNNISNYLKHDSSEEKQSSSLNQMAELGLHEEHVISSLRRGFGNHIHLQEGAFSEWEVIKIEELVQNRYSQDEWMFKR